MNPESIPFDFKSWLQTMAVTAGVAVAVCYLFTALRYGPLSAGDRLFAVAKSALKDLLFLSPRRTAAIAWLSVKESIRKQAVAGLILFLLVLAIALWFLDPESVDPSALYVSFVLTAVNYLVLLMAVVTSAFSLPNDIKNRTIYTIVTKPVRPSEIVLGRVLGFAFVCTVPLAIMGISSYFFVVRSLDHTHTLTAADLRTVATSGLGASAPEVGTQEGTTSTVRNHKHRIAVGPQGNGTTQMSDSSKLAADDSDSFLERFGQSHWHRVTGSQRDGKMVYTVGPPEGQFHARVPIFGTLTFKDPEGNTNSQGLNVGNWTKRGYVAGGTLSAAMYKYDDVYESEFPDGLRLQMDIRLFRTTKEGLDKPILGSIVVRNPSTGLTSAPRNFAAREYYTLEQFIPRALTDVAGKPIDLFKNLVHDGTVIVELQCIPRSQLFGVGPTDVYLLAREGRFDVNFAKAFFGIWLQALLTVTIGVFWSTFLSGPVAMLATTITIIAAVMKPVLISVAQGTLFGTAVHSGGMLESAVRVLQQKATAIELDEGMTTEVIKAFDKQMSWVVEGLLRFVPDFAGMSDVENVARGFDLSPALVFEHALQAGAFAIPLFLAGFLIFKLVEVAK
ncbi:MAG: hypothetical protein K8U03_21350 [Planctomycetia bacterium]|nr:hypothetical protein [Planctomycetia bacterium]